MVTLLAMGQRFTAHMYQFSALVRAGSIEAVLRPGDPCGGTGTCVVLDDQDSRRRGHRACPHDTVRRPGRPVDGDGDAT